jgi:hypothetical protein
VISVGFFRFCSLWIVTFFAIALTRGWPFAGGMSLRCLSLVVLLGAGALAGAADPAGSSLDSLVKNSPFGTAASAATGGETAQLEFRGVMVEKGEQFFSFFDASSRTSQWVGLKESGAPFQVQSYDSGTQTVKLVYRSQPFTLTLKRAQIIVQAPPPPGTGPAVKSIGPAVGPAQPADNAAQMAQVAEEIRRRRSLRTGGQPPMPVPTPATSGGPLPIPVQSTPNRP